MAAMIEAVRVPKLPNTRGRDASCVLPMLRRSETIPPLVPTEGWRVYLIEGKDDYPSLREPGLRYIARAVRRDAPSITDDIYWTTRHARRNDPIYEDDYNQPIPLWRRIRDQPHNKPSAFSCAEAAGVFEGMISNLSQGGNTVMIDLRGSPSLHCVFGVAGMDDVNTVRT